MKDGRILASGTTEELVTMVEGKVWTGFIPIEQLAEYERKLQVVNLKNEENGMVSIRYLSKDPGIADSKKEVPRLEDLYLWLFPEDRFEKEAE